MRLPKRIAVGALTYQVQSNRAAMNQVCRDQQSDLLGHCNHRGLMISIEPNQADGQKRDTLLHEVMHAAFDTTGLSAEWGDKDEEQAIRRLAPVLLDVLRRNPPLVAALLAER